MTGRLIFEPEGLLGRELEKLKREAEPSKGFDRQIACTTKEFDTEKLTPHRQ